VPLNHPTGPNDVTNAASMWTSESALRRLEDVLSCRDALQQNVKPRFRGRGDDHVDVRRIAVTKPLLVSLRSGRP